LKALVEAKVNHMPIPKDEPAPQSGKVINLMDALRASIGAETKKKPAAASTKVRSGTAAKRKAGR